MLLTRRLFVTTAIASMAGLTSGVPSGAMSAKPDLYAAAWVNRSGAGFSIVDGNGTELSSTSLPERGHDVAADPVGHWIVAFARRPGNFAVAVDRKAERQPIAFTTPEDRHFFGHGVFSPDGRLLYATENDFENAAGMIGIYDATANFHRIGEFPSHGMDPHELLLMPDGRTICIANGGIETHPDYGRAKLNLASMEPSIVFIDIATGDLLEKHTPPSGLSRLSTRHMDIDGNGDVWIGCQYEGPETDEPPLILRVTQGDGYKPVMLPRNDQQALSNYIGSVAAHKGEDRIAVTSPHGNCALIIDSKTGNLVKRIDKPDVCGVAVQGRDFLLSSGAGEFGTFKSDRAWDNHITRIPG